MQAIEMPWSLIVVASICFAAGAGCRAPTAAFPKNVVAIDSDGSLRLAAPDRGDRHSPAPQRLFRNAPPAGPGAQAEYNERTRQVARELFRDNLPLDKSTNILIFIQGGLNDLSDGVRRANLLTQAILGDCHHPAYPFFVAWDASLPSAWREQYTTYRGGSASTATAVLLAPATFAANAGRLFTRLPLSLFEQAYAGLRTMSSGRYADPEARGYFLRRSERVQERYLDLAQEGYRVQFYGGGTAARIQTRGALMLAQAPPKIVSTGVVDTGGKAGWDFMLRRTKTMYTQAASFRDGGMSLFAEELIAYLAHPEHRNKTVTLVAHSMGAIVANEFVRRFGDRLPIANIVYMAAACGVEDFERSVVPYLRSRDGARFYNLCLHPANDSSELAWWWTEPVAPQGSLLEWIDGYYSSTETDYGWTLGKWENAILGTTGLKRAWGEAESKRQLEMKSFGYGAEATQGPQKHGGFDKWTFWNPAFWQVGPFDPDWRHHFLD